MNVQEASNTTPSGVGSLVPPRPNLGPEAWPESQGSAQWVIGGTVLVAVCLALVVSNRRKNRSRSTELSNSGDPPGDRPPSDRDRLIAASDRLRQALLDAFGTTWRSKTTEEIGRDPQIVDWLDVNEFDQLMSFLRLVDRAKFAQDDPPSIRDWEEVADAILKKFDTRNDPKSPPKAR